MLTAALGPFVTDHRAVIATLNIKKLKPITNTILVWQVGKVSDDQWGKEFNPDNIQLTGKLNTLVSSFNTELRMVYNKLAPLKKFKVNLRSKQPWYDTDMKAMKRKVCKYEKKWLKYKLESLWVAYKKVRNSYFSLLNAKKKGILQDKIKECSKDSHKLHVLVNNLTCKQVEEEWLKHTNDDELAEGFASYFQNKIEKIRDLFKDKPRYNPIKQNVPSFRGLHHSQRARSVKLSPLLSLSPVNWMLSQQQYSRRCYHRLSHLLLRSICP